MFSVIILRIAIGASSEEGETALVRSGGGGGTGAGMFSMARMPSRHSSVHKDRTGEDGTSQGHEEV